MPCKDSSSQMTLTLDGDERLIDYAFGKITCGRIIGGEARYLEMCRGKSAEEILRIGFAEVVEHLGIAEGEEQFFLFLEWDAVRSGLSHYVGGGDADSERCQVASVDYDEDRVVIRLIIKPPKEMPKILPCSIADRKG